VYLFGGFDDTAETTSAVRSASEH